MKRKTKLFTALFAFTLSFGSIFGILDNSNKVNEVKAKANPDGFNLVSVRAADEEKTWKVGDIVTFGDIMVTWTTDPVLGDNTDTIASECRGAVFSFTELSYSQGSVVTTNQKTEYELENRGDNIIDFYAYATDASIDWHVTFTITIPEVNPFYIEKVGGTNDVRISIDSSKSTSTNSFKYSYDGTTWTDGFSFTLNNTNKKVYIEGSGSHFSSASYSYRKFTSTSSSGCELSIGGDISSLINYSTTLGNYEFYNLFSDDFYLRQYLISASDLILPATTLAEHCYSSMFSSCSALTSAPVLPATVLAKSCYESMFSSCGALTSAPDLPATKLVSDCYASMFARSIKINKIKIGYTGNFNTTYFSDWVKGVSTTGTFYYEGTDYTFGSSSIPFDFDNKWIVINSKLKTEVNVTLDKNGGTGGTNSVTLIHEGSSNLYYAKEDFVSITIPTKENYVFMGYYSENNSKVPFYTSDGKTIFIQIAETFDFGESLTLIARWYRTGEIVAEMFNSKMEAICDTLGVNTDTAKLKQVWDETASDYANLTYIDKGKFKTRADKLEYSIVFGGTPTQTSVEFSENCVSSDSAKYIDFSNSEINGYYPHYGGGNGVVVEEDDLYLYASNNAKFALSSLGMINCSKVVIHISASTDGDGSKIFLNDGAVSCDFRDGNKTITIDCFDIEDFVLESIEYQCMGSFNYGTKFYQFDIYSLAYDGDPTMEPMVSMVEKYDYIYRKYGEALGLDNFLGREIEQLQNKRIIFGLSETQKSSGAIVAVAIVCLTAIAGFFFMKKTKDTSL